jgi:hypothetical protein
MSIIRRFSLVVPSLTKHSYNEKEYDKSPLELFELYLSSLIFCSFASITRLSYADHRRKLLPDGFSKQAETRYILHADDAK